MLHEPGRPAQRTAPIGLTEEQRALLLKGMEMVTQRGGTAHLFTDGRGLTPLPMRIAGKTGTAQKDTPKGKINFAWFIGFAPLDNPQIAVAVAVEGDTPGEETGGGRYAGPVAHALFKTWLAKKPRAAASERTESGKSARFDFPTGRARVSARDHPARIRVLRVFRGRSGTSQIHRPASPTLPPAAPVFQSPTLGQSRHISRHAPPNRFHVSRPVVIGRRRQYVAVQMHHRAGRVQPTRQPRERRHRRRNSHTSSQNSGARGT
jgi:membrane peptidoglycan carboxypeptidase